jgi:hypothetical protein
LDYLPAFSGNSAYVVYQLDVYGPYYISKIHRYEIESRTRTLVAVNASAPSISGDGCQVAFLTKEYPSGQSWDIKVYNLTNDQTQLVSANLAGTGGGNGDSSHPFISADGRYVVFLSLASDLVENDHNGTTDVFVHDLATSNTVCITRNYLGTGSGGGTSFLTGLGADGRTVIFHSYADDLIPNDFNQQGDYFVLRLASADTDGDGMEDDWEWANFGTLARDGAGDFDGDGMSDLAEYRAGTSPVDNAACLRFFTLASDHTNVRRLFWQRVPGQSYRVQYKDELGQTNWTNLAGDITADGNQASLVDTNTSPSQRFYRVVLE